MNKKDLTETDIRTKFITPPIIGLNGDKWNVMTQLTYRKRCSDFGRAKGEVGFLNCTPDEFK